MELDDMTIEDIEEYLKERKREENKPKPKENINFDKLVFECAGYVDDLSNGSNTSGYETSIYEVAMECIYGEKIHDWIEETEWR